MSTEPQRAVKYVMGRPVSVYMKNDVLVLPRGMLTRRAASMMQSSEHDDVVVTEGGVPVGIVTDEDILGKVGDYKVTAEETTLGDIMSEPLHTIDEHASLREAINKMNKHGIRKLPVLSKKNTVIGIITHGAVAVAVRNAAATKPRLLSPPVKAILGNLGFVLQFAGALLLVPAIVATVLNDTVTATGIYLTTVLLLVTGFFLNSYGEKASLNMQQASILVFVSLFILTLFGTIPYLYVAPPGEGSAAEVFANSFFSSAAGFTTGGISIYDPDELPQSFTFFRSFTQLVGGMSFIYLVITAFYPESKLRSMRGFISGRTLHMRELFGTITFIFGLYIVIVATLLYLFGEQDILDNISLAMSTLATGGFVPSSTILEDMVWQEHLILMAAMILGALPFTFHYGFVRKKFLSPRLGKEVLAYFALLGGAALLFTWVSGLGPVFGTFYTVSASTTAGLQISSLESLSGPAHAILILLMFVGGCGFSTAGGIKIYRFMQVRGAWRLLRGGLRGGEDATKDEKDERKETATAVLIIMLFPLIAGVTTIHLMGITDATLDNAFLEAAGLITTGGLSADVITAELDPATMITFGFLMIFGRLEIIAILYIFVPRLAP
ncbi:Trk-type K transport system, membrane component [Cenarchaeum symbiosum A]|uniref:Trk-type K transport system, membrane component n=1 Tax=Cenarchaeum symbiosum (strain A) TaxID=414004 RepID=A0RW24_CENSY|nr:Trk-type K transport system, membrane component [Cenarchaeum symbiosum A]